MATGTIRPGARGLNSKLLDAENKFKAFLSQLFGGGGEEDAGGMTFDPSRILQPERPMGGITQRPGAGPVLPEQNIQFDPSRIMPQPKPMGGITQRNAPGMELPPVFQQREQPAPSNIPPEAFMGMENQPPQMPASFLKPPGVTRPPMMPQRPMSMPTTPRGDMSGLMTPPAADEMNMGRQRDMSEMLGDVPNESPGMVDQPIDFGMEEQPARGDRFSNNDEPRTDEYLSHLRKRPRHEDYRPSTGRKIGSGILGSLLGTDFGIREAPYNRELRKWSDEGSGLKEGAGFEQAGIREKRLGLRDALIHERANRRFNEQRVKAMLDYETRNAAIDQRAQTGADRTQVEREKIASREQLQKEIIGLRRRMLQEVSIPRVQAYSRGIDARIDGGNKPLSGAQQKAITDQARRETGRDPRFSKFFDETTNTFSGEVKDSRGKVIETITPETQDLIQREILRNEDRIANRDRDSYRRELLQTDWFDPFEMDSVMGEPDGID